MVSTSDEVEYIVKRDGTKFSIPAHHSVYQPLADAYLQIMESEDINEDFKTGQLISGMVVQARRFTAGNQDGQRGGGVEIIAIVQVPVANMYRMTITSSVVYFTISCVLFIIATIMSIVIGTCVTCPLHNVIGKMKRIKTMELEKIKVGSSFCCCCYLGFGPTFKNPLMEVRSIENSLQFTIEKLKEYRAFLPTNMMGKGGDLDLVIMGEDEDRDLFEEEDDGSNSSQMSATHVLLGAAEGATKNMLEEEEGENGSESDGDSTDSGTGTSHSKLSSSRRSSNKSDRNFNMFRQKKRTKFDLGFSGRRMTVVSVEFPMRRLQFYYGVFLGLHRTGFYYQFYFDHLVIFIMNDSLARRFILQLNDQFMEHKEDRDITDCRIIVVCGHGYYGNLGNDQIKKFSVGGEVMSKLDAFRHRVPKYLDFVCCGTAKKILFREEFVMRMIFDEDTYQVGRKADLVGGQEWMYELKEKGEIEKWNGYNESIQKFREGDIDDSFLLMKDFVEKNEDDQLAEKWLGIMKEKIKLEKLEEKYAESGEVKEEEKQ